MIRTRRLRTGLFAGALGLSLLLAGCGDSSDDSAAPSEGDGSGLDGKTIAFVGYGNENPWGAAYNKTLMDALDGSGVQIDDLASMDPGVQIQNLNQAVAEKPDLIVAILLDTASAVVPIQKAEQAGIPVLIVDGRPDPAVEDSVLSVLSDNPMLGSLAAENLIEGMKAQGRDSGKVIVLAGTKSMLVTQDRMTGFNEVMAANPEFEVIEEQDTNWDPTLSGEVAQQLFAKYGCDGIQGAYGMADYMALPIVQAAKQAGCKVGGENGIIITGGNCFKVGIDSIKAGELYGTATEDPITIANATADYVEQYFNGEEPPQSVTIEEHRITADNVDEFAEQCSQA
jgi:ABC-type sugar transport system substrate-binding protein